MGIERTTCAPSILFNLFYVHIRYERYLKETHYYKNIVFFYYKINLIYLIQVTTIDNSSLQVVVRMLHQVYEKCLCLITIIECVSMSIFIIKS